MKKLLLCLLTLSVTLCFSQEDITINHNAPDIEFETEIIDLGEFMQYDDPSSKCEFKFKNTGKEFLQTILEKGGSREPMELFVDFRGRKPNIDALLRHSGIAA